MKRLKLILGDQLSEALSSIAEADSEDLIVMAEVHDEASYVRHHKQKIALIFAAMRKFRDKLQDRGLQVLYFAYDAPTILPATSKATSQQTSGPVNSIPDALTAALQSFEAEQIDIVCFGEYRLDAILRNWANQQKQPVNFLEDNRFIASLDEFNKWAAGRKQYRMEFFYREMRRKTGLLMDADEPVGGKWNFDAENRKKLPKGHALPARLAHQYDQDTLDVFTMVEREFADNFGSLDAFFWPVTDVQAQQNLKFFLDNCLANFGDYQDAMKQDQSLLYHSLIATSLNIGLLDPVDVCRQAEQRYRDGAAPLNAVEGFIRQIIGWREYIRGIYWHFMPDYKSLNFFNYDRPLPAFYYDGNSQMNCMDQAVQTTHDFAYAHHIQRLMVTGNFALLAGLDPAQVNQWYLEVYADAYEWVELPNTHGMALFADGGVVASKPYAASGAYINRMSDYCANCKYDVKQAYGEQACPFNFLYWNFMIEQEPRLSNNPRMGMVYRNLEKMDDQKRAGVQVAAKDFLSKLDTLK